MTVEPLRLGALTVDPPVVLAPMAGVTDAAFRRLCRSFGGGLYVSEMVQAGTLVQGDPTALRITTFAPDEPVRSVQVAATDPAVMAAAVRRLVDELGADHLDVNLGCPMPKVTRRGGGAALASRPERVAAVVGAAVGAAGRVPVTVKLRAGLDDRRPTALAAGRAAVEAGAAAVAVHARTATQLYAGPADWSVIGELVEALTVPVLGNGDVWTAADAVAMVAATGCAGVVVGRGCLGRPWLFRDLDAAFAGRPVPPPPTLDTVAVVAGRHLALLVDEHGELAGVRRFRKHLGWYVTGYPVRSEVLAPAMRATSLAEAASVLDAVAAGGPRPPLDPAAPRGPAQGPRPVALPHGWDLPTPQEPASGANDEPVAAGSSRSTASGLRRSST